MFTHIEEGVALPQNRARYDFSVFTEAGQSSFIPADDPNKKAVSVRAAARRYTRNTGIRFLVRAADGGVRVWRVTPSN